MPGIATESAKIASADLVSELKKYLKKKGSSYLGLIHRLDQPVEGILVFAKNPEAAANLTKQVQYDEKNGKGMLKKYKAILYGHMPTEEGTLVDFILKNAKDNTAMIVAEAKAKELKAKKAILDYKVISKDDNKDDNIETVDITLKTGRHHQIRAQFAKAGCPLLGDMKYGSEASKQYSQDNAINTVELKAYKLEFDHPDTRKRMSFEI